MIKQNGENFEIVYQLGGDHEYHASNTPLFPTISFTSVGIDHLHLLRISNVFTDLDYSAAFSGFN